MKKLLPVFLMFFITGSLSAQITLEHSYDSSSIISDNNLLYMVKLEVDSYKYIRVFGKDASRQITFYNLDHSIWKTIDMTHYPIPALCFPSTTINYRFYILYVTQHLFNSDDSIEFMYTSPDNCHTFTNIYSESGRLLFNGDSLYPGVQISVPQDMRPIYNTPLGTKMILSHIDRTARVYSLGGHLSTSVNMLPGEGTSEFAISPTPSSDFTKVNFSLPQGIDRAQIFVYDIHGDKIREYAVDNSFNDLVISNRDLPAGNYFFSLVHHNETITRKQVIIH